MKKNEIPTIIHYPTPIEKTGAYEYLNQYNKVTRDMSKKIVSLPIPVSYTHLTLPTNREV